MTVPELSVGADVDVGEIMAEVAEAVQRKREAGLYPPEVLMELDQAQSASGGADPGGLLAPALADLQRSSRFTARVTTASRKPLIAPVIAAGRRALRASLSWYMNGVLQQVARFADSTVRAAGLLAERTDTLDRRLERLESEVGELAARTSAIKDERPQEIARLHRLVRGLRDRIETLAEGGAVTPDGHGARPGAWSWAAERSFDYLQFENRFRGDPEEIANRQRMYLDLFRPARLPVVDLGCGRGEFLSLLREAGVTSYGVDRHADMVEVCRRKGLEVLEADSVEHLAAVDPASLGGVFCAQMIEHLIPAEVPTFFELAAKALAPGAPLVVETINPKSLFVFAHAFYVDLGHLRPLHPLTLEFLAREVGFTEAKIEYLAVPPPEFRPQPLPPAEDERLAELVARVDENFRRIDDILFGPQDFAVIAYR